MKSSTAKVVRFHETGDASVLKIEALPVPEPGEYELRIKVEAIGLNRAEVMFRNGAYLETPQLPSRLGYEAAGVVIVITAASSSVGVAAIQIAKHVGAVVIATTRSENKKRFLIGQGADHVIQTDSENLIERMAEISPDTGAELIFDSIGGPILNQLAEVTAIKAG